MRKNKNKNKNLNINQTSFYFEDYLETNQKSKKINKSNISQDRIYLLFFLFLSLIIVFAIKITSPPNVGTELTFNNFGEAHNWHVLTALFL